MRKRCFFANLSCITNANKTKARAGASIFPRLQRNLKMSFRWKQWCHSFRTFLLMGHESNPTFTGPLEKNSFFHSGCTQGRGLCRVALSFPPRGDVTKIFFRRKHAGEGETKWCVYVRRRYTISRFPTLTQMRAFFPSGAQCAPRKMKSVI